MKAIILAAGQGTRLKKYTENLPKGMLPFNGKTIIERQIELFRSCGIDRIIVIRGFAGDRIQYKDVTYYTNTEYATTNMIESLLAAKGEFDNDIIVSYSDVLFTKEMLDRMIGAKGDYVVAVDDNWKSYWQARYGRVDFDTESLTIDGDSNILSLGKENPDPSEIDARYVGLLKFSAIGLKKITEILDEAYRSYIDKPWKQSGKAVRQAYMTDLLQAIIESDEKVKAERFNNGWIEFDTNEDYENACRWLEEGTLGEYVGIESL
nr:phosphocholine cytidylyltransferase family protein [uncultured Dethiosulfovibrio sp.]